LILFHFFNNRLNLCEILFELLEDTLEISFHGFHYFYLNSLLKYLRAHQLEPIQRVLDQLNVNQKLVRQVNDICPLLIKLKFHLRYFAKIGIKHIRQRINLAILGLQFFLCYLFLLYLFRCWHRLLNGLPDLSDTFPLHLLELIWWCIVTALHTTNLTHFLLYSFFNYIFKVGF